MSSACLSAFKRKRTPRKRKSRISLPCSVGSCQTLTFPRGPELLPGDRSWLWQQNKGASITEGTTPLQENYSEPWVPQSSLFRFQIAAKEEEGRKPGVEETRGSRSPGERWRGPAPLRERALGEVARVAATLFQSEKQ